MAAQTAASCEETVISSAVKMSQQHPVTQKSSPSIVADVLSKKGLHAADSLNKAMKDLSHKTETLKSEINQLIYKQYTEFYHSFNFGEELNKKLAKLVREMNQLGDDIQNGTLNRLTTAESDLLELTKEYDKNQEVIKALKKLCKIHEGIQTCTAGVNVNYLLPAKAIKNVRGYLNDLSSGSCEVMIFKAVRDEYRVQKALLITQVKEKWANMLEWTTVTSASWDSIEGHLKTSLKVHTLDSNKDEHNAPGHGMTSLTSLYEAMECLEIFDTQLKTFAKKMMNFLLKPLVIFPGLRAVINSEEKDSYSLKFTRENKKMKSRRPDSVAVYGKIVDVIQFITTYVFPNPQPEDPNASAGNAPVGIERSTACMKLQSLIWPDLSELLIKESLSHAIPTSDGQLQKYDMFVQKTSDFEEALYHLGFLANGTNTLTSYLKDINVHFANKKCQDLLVEARDLMTTEVHNMVKVEPDKDRARVVPNLIEDDKFSKEMEMMLSGLKDIPKNSLGTVMFHFPECRISETTQKFMNLVYKTLLEATTSTPQVAIQLFYSVRNMFELYSAVVPTYHQESFELPQLAALHYNNCMFLAHHCITLGHQFRHTLPEPLSQGVATFVDLVPMLRKCGEKCFLQQLRKQKLQLQEILRDCNGFCQFDDELTILAAQNAFEQILHLLVRLSKVWRGVLPTNIYEKSLGSLFNTVLDDIATQIIQLEDISADEATQFHWLLKILVNRAGEIFNLKGKEENTTEDMGFIVHIQSWQKFNEIINMMESSLQGIVDRWADGKGPLAQAFDAQDVKCLIKALFQNTSRRAQALAKIKPL